MMILPKKAAFFSLRFEFILLKEKHIIFFQILFLKFNLWFLKSQWSLRGQIISELNKL